MGKEKNLRVEPGKSISFEEVCEIKRSFNDSTSKHRKKKPKQVCQPSQSESLEVESASTVPNDVMLAEEGDGNCIEKDDVVRIRDGKYQNYVAKVLGSSIGDEYEIQYVVKICIAGSTRNQSNFYFSLIPNDYDSREETELEKIESRFVYYEGDKLYILQ